jgi:hypothetical protein
MFFRTPIPSIHKATFFREEKKLKNGKTSLKIKGYTKEVVQSVASSWCEQHQATQTKLKKSEGFWVVSCKGM